jgi:hypothetical protein
VPLPLTVPAKPSSCKSADGSAGSRRLDGNRAGFARLDGAGIGRATDRRRFKAFTVKLADASAVARA